MLDDVALVLTVTFVHHILSHIINDEPLFDEKGIGIMLYLCLGITAYHLVVRKFLFSKVLNFDKITDSNESNNKIDT